MPLNATSSKPAGASRICSAFTDLLIAARALAQGAVFMTGNRRKFSKVDRLALENWIDTGG